MNDVVKLAGLLFVVFGVPLGLLTVLAPSLLRRQSERLLPNPAMTEQLEVLRSEVAELRTLPRLGHELEQRMDFVERMPGPQRSANQLSGER
jgi:hypothetical protein